MLSAKNFGRVPEGGGPSGRNVLEPEEEDMGTDEAEEIEEKTQEKDVEASQEIVESEKDFETPFERMTLEKEAREIEKHEEGLEISEETKETAELYIKQEHEEKHNEFALDWFEEHKGELKNRGEPIEVSDERKIEIAGRNGAFRELMEKDEYKDKYWKEIEDISSIMVDFRKEKISPDGLALAFNRIEKKAEKIEEELKGEKLQGGARFAKEQELDRLFQARQEMAEKISGRDLDKEAKAEAVKAMEENRNYGNREEYIDKNFGESILEAKEQEKTEVFEREWNNLSDDKKKKYDNDPIKFIENQMSMQTATEHLGRKLTEEEVLALKAIGYNPANFKERGLLKKKIEIEKGERLSDKEFENLIEQSKESFNKKIGERVKKDLGDKWDSEHQRLTRENIEKNIKELAKSPEKAEPGIETVYSRLKDRLISEDMEKGLKKEDKTKEQLEKISKEFEKKGEDPIKFIEDVLDRKGGLEGLRGKWEDDEKKIGDFLDKWGVPVDSEKLKKFLEGKEKKGQNYEKMVEKKKGFLLWLLELIEFLLTPLKEEEERRKGQKKKR